MKTIKIILTVLLFTAISFAQDDYTSINTGEQIDNGVRPYKVYTALLTQSGTNAPVATVLENTLGGVVVWSRAGGGDYTGTLTGAFLQNKTFLYILNGNGADGQLHITMEWLSVDAIHLTESDVGLDGALNTRSVEIRVYP